LNHLLIYCINVVGKTFETFDLQTGKAITRVFKPHKEDVDLVVKVAHVTFDQGL
jgi:hypothetical protein